MTKPNYDIFNFVHFLVLKICFYLLMRREFFIVLQISLFKKITNGHVLCLLTKTSILKKMNSAYSWRISWLEMKVNFQIGQQNKNNFLMNQFNKKIKWAS